jgi:cytochrome c-type biogenesis protein CcmH/NrfG
VTSVYSTYTDQIANKAEYLLLRGKALNVLPNFDSEAQEVLSKAVKLDPKLVEGWVQLGEVYWKNKDVGAAKNCFVGALNHVGSIFNITFAHLNTKL